MQTEVIKLAGMNTEAETAAVICALTGIRGVSAVNASYEDESVVAKFDENQTGRQEMVAVLAKAGFTPKTENESGSAQRGCCGGCGG